MGVDQSQNVLWRLQHMELELTAPEEIVVNNLSRGAVAQGAREVVNTLWRRWSSARLTPVGLLPRGKKLVYRLNDRLEINRHLPAYATSIGAVFVESAPVFLCKNTANKCSYYVNDMVHLTAGGYEALKYALIPSVRALQTTTSRHE